MVSFAVFCLYLLTILVHLQNSVLEQWHLEAGFMALLSFILNPKSSLQRSSLSLSFGLIPNISSSLFSTLCRGHPSSQASPPVPKKVPFTVSVHGRTWQDPYRWMSNTNDPDLSDHLNQENSYADAFMADTHHLQQTLVSEMTSRMPTKISTPPERWGPWFAHFPHAHFIFLQNLL